MCCFIQMKRMSQKCWTQISQQSESLQRSLLIISTAEYNIFRHTAYRTRTNQSPGFFVCIKKFRIFGANISGRRI